MIYIVKTEKHYKYLDEPYATFETIELDSALRIIDRFVMVTALYVDDVLFLGNNSDETIVIFDLSCIDVKVLKPYIEDKYIIGAHLYQLVLLLFKNGVVVNRTYDIIYVEDYLFNSRPRDTDNPPAANLPHIGIDNIIKSYGDNRVCGNIAGCNFYTYKHFGISAKTMSKKDVNFFVGYLKCYPHIMTTQIKIAKIQKSPLYYKDKANKTVYTVYNNLYFSCSKRHDATMKNDLIADFWRFINKSTYFCYDGFIYYLALKTKRMDQDSLDDKNIIVPCNANNMYLMLFKYTYLHYIRGYNIIMKTILDSEDKNELIKAADKYSSNTVDCDKMFNDIFDKHKEEFKQFKLGN